MMRYARASTRRAPGPNAKPKNDLAMKTAPYNYGGSIRGTELTLQYKIDSCLNSHLRVTARRIVRSATELNDLPQRWSLAFTEDYQQ